MSCLCNCVELLISEQDFINILYKTNNYEGITENMCLYSINPKYTSLIDLYCIAYMNKMCYLINTTKSAQYKPTKLNSKHYKLVKNVNIAPYSLKPSVEQYIENNYYCFIKKCSPTNKLFVLNS